MAESREDILKRFRKKIKEGRPIIGGGAGTGISAKCEEAGGIDLIVIYNSGRFRMAGHGSLAGLMPFGDANAIVLEMANEVLPERGSMMAFGELGRVGAVSTQHEKTHSNPRTVALVDGRSWHHKRPRGAENRHGVLYRYQLRTAESQRDVEGVRELQDRPAEDSCGWPARQDLR